MTISIVFVRAPAPCILYTSVLKSTEFAISQIQSQESDIPTRFIHSRSFVNPKPPPQQQNLPQHRTHTLKGYSMPIHFRSCRLLILFLFLSGAVECFRSSSNIGSDIQQSPSSSRSPSKAMSSSTSLPESGSGAESPSPPPSLTDLSIGFLGCGTIAVSISRGLARATQEESISIRKLLVSRRSESKSAALARDLAGITEVSVQDSNQAIVDACDLVFLTVLPQQAQAVLEGLDFDPNRHVLVSLVSTANLQDLVRDSKLDLSRVAKMICLPSIANHKGVALLCCGDKPSTSDGSGGDGGTHKLLNDLFGAMGGVVSLDTEADLEACMVTTCTMGPLYGTMKHQRDWLLEKTDSLTPAEATFLVVRQFAGALSDAESTALAYLNESSSDDDRGEVLANRLEALIDEQTPGGLNEQALKNYGEVLGGFRDVQTPVMDAILSRIRGETDGSL